MISKPKTKVLFVLPALTAGGAERVLITFMNALDRGQYAPEMLSVKGEGALSDMIADNTPFHRLEQNLTPLSLPKLYLKIKQIKPDIIVSTMAHMNFAVLALKPFLPHTRFVVREAITPSFFFKKHKAKAAIIKTFYKCLYPLADVILSPTGKVFEELRDELNIHHDNFIVLNNPIDKAGIQAQIELSTVPAVPKDTHHFVACGRLHPQKGYDRLIEALGQAKFKFNWHLDILGEGDERERLDALIKTYSLQNNIQLRGHVSPPYSYMAAADLFLLPSRFEGSPNVVLEALACNTPVIATRESGGIDEIRDSGNADKIDIAQDMNEFIDFISQRCKQ